MEQPLVSIGLPVYNGGKYLDRSISALLAQDYENIELIISDNGSTDATAEICEHYAQKDSRIIFHRRERNFGGAANFKYVLQQAKGPYFMWAAADDYWYPEFVSKLIPELEGHPEANVAMSALERRWEDGATHDVVRFAGRANPNSMNCFRMAMAMVRKTLYHHYIYGIYRTAFLRSVMAYSYPAVPSGDRVFMCHVALLTRFRYIDEVLHLRTLSRIPLQVKYPDEKFAQLKKEKLGFIKTGLSLIGLLFQSTLIPSWYKIFIPLILLNFGFGFWREIVGPFIPFVPLTRREMRQMLARLSRQP